MRAEVKVGLVVGLVAIAGGVIWWFSRPTNELEELPFDRTAMEATSADDTALASDATAAGPGVQPEDTAAPAERERLTPAPARRTGPVPTLAGEREAAPQEPAATMSPTEELSESALRKVGAKPTAERAAPGEAARAPTRAGERESVDFPPPDVPAPRRRSRLAEPQPLPRETYAIQPGDRLIDIAQEEYGDGQLWRAIKAANPGIDENRLQIGAKIEIPSREEALRLTRAGAPPTADASATALRRAQPGAVSGKAGRATYVVGQGDSLIRIARNVLSDETRWEEIYELNRDQLESPNLIYPGMELRLPPLEKKTSPEDTARG